MNKKEEFLEKVGKNILEEFCRDDFLRGFCKGNDLSIINILAVRIEKYINYNELKKALNTKKNIEKEIQKIVNNIMKTLEKTKLPLDLIWMWFNYEEVIKDFSIYVDKNYFEMTDINLILKFTDKTDSNAVHILDFLHKFKEDYIKEGNFNNKYLASGLWNCYYLNNEKIPELWDAIKEIGSCITHKVFVEYNGLNYITDIYIHEKDFKNIKKKNKFKFFEECYDYYTKFKDPVYAPLDNKTTANSDYYLTGFVGEREENRYLVEDSTEAITEAILEYRKGPIALVGITDKYAKEQAIRDNNAIEEKRLKYKPENIKELIFPESQKFILRWDNYPDHSYFNAVNLMIKDDLPVPELKNLNNEEDIISLIAEKVKESGDPALPLSFLTEWTNNEELVKKLPLFVDKKYMEIKNHYLILKFSEEENKIHIIDALKNAKEKYINEGNIPDIALAEGYYKDLNYRFKFINLIESAGQEIEHSVIEYNVPDHYNLYNDYESQYMISKFDLARILEKNKNLKFIDDLFYKENLTSNLYFSRYSENNPENYVISKKIFDYEFKDVETVFNITKVLINNRNSKLIAYDVM